MSSVPYFGRAWNITIKLQSTGELLTVSNSDWEPEALRCTFRVDQVALARWWNADIVIYNFLPGLRKTIQAGDVVTITAGYQSPGSGLIFKGKVFQPIWERANETDYTLTLHCLVGLWDLKEPKVSVSLPANISRAKQVALVAQAANPPIDIGSLDPALDSAPKNPRATSIFESPTLFFADTAASVNLNFWYGYNGVNIRSLAPKSDTPDVVYLPPYASAPKQASTGLTKYTLVGTPQQAEDGVDFRALLDSDVQLGQLAQIVSTEIKKIPLYPGQVVFVDPDGIYVVVAITHLGDTRGNDWYSDVHAVVRPLAKRLAVMAR